jgi:RimJ/RimL family protein N-acetyltransferase
VTLRLLRLGDARRVRQWFADPAFVRMVVYVPDPAESARTAYTKVEADNYLLRLMYDGDRHAFAIEFGGTHVGIVGLKEVDPIAHTAECFIEIGDPAMRRRGVGRNAMQQLLAYAFDDLSLERIRLAVFEFNEPARKLYEALGFTDDGIYGHHWADGVAHPMLAMVLDVAAWRAAGPRGG